MFTGIIEFTGSIRTIQRLQAGASMVVSSPEVSSGLKVGDSIAVNGVCLTAVHCMGDAFACDLSAETLARTSFGKASEGAPVNLERALLIGSRLGGHFVQGHIDGVGSLAATVASSDGSLMTFEFPLDLVRYIVTKGSIAVDGISLTVASLQGNCFSVAVIPHTLLQTNLGTLRPGDPVNLEVDILAKYVERFCQPGLVHDRSSKWNLEYLREQGF